MAKSNVVTDIKRALKAAIERRLDPVGLATEANPGFSLGPSAKGANVHIRDVNMDTLMEERQDVPIITIQLIADTPNLDRGQPGQSNVFYRTPSTDIPGVEKTVVDEDGTTHTGVDFKDRYIRPQHWVLRFEIQTASVHLDELEETHCQLQSLFEGQRTSQLAVTRNEGDASEYEETFRVRSQGGRIVRWNNGAKSIILLDVFAYHDVAQSPVRERTLQSYDWNVEANQ